MTKNVLDRALSHVIKVVNQTTLQFLGSITVEIFKAPQ